MKQTVVYGTVNGIWYMVYYYVYLKRVANLTVHLNRSNYDFCRS